MPEFTALLEPVWTILTTGGPYGLSVFFLWIWWQEREERKEMQKYSRDQSEKIIEFVEKSIESSNKMEQALNTLKDVIRNR